MSKKSVASIKTLARYEPDTVYIGNGEYVAECVRANDGDYYLAADADAAVEALQAEIEALRAEVERLKSMTAVTMGVGRGDGNLFVHGDYDSIKAAQALVLRAERMKKALKDIRSLSSINSAMNPSLLALTVLLGDIHHIADAVLSK